MKKLAILLIAVMGAFTVSAQAPRNCHKCDKHCVTAQVKDCKKEACDKAQCKACDKTQCKDNKACCKKQCKDQKVCKKAECKDCKKQCKKVCKKK